MTISMKKVVAVVSILVGITVTVAFTHHHHHQAAQVNKVNSESDYVSKQLGLEKKYVLTHAEGSLQSYDEMRTGDSTIIVAHKFVVVKASGSDSWETLIADANNWNYSNGDMTLSLIRATNRANGIVDVNTLSPDTGYVAVPIIDTKKTPPTCVWMDGNSDSYSKAIQK